jgi:prephenate dehydrogenase
LGAGKMGSWFVESLCLDYEVGIFDLDKKKLRYFFNAYRFTGYDEIREFNPDIVINAVSLQHTTKAFDEVIPYLSKDCILSDITSVKNGLVKYYPNTGMRFVSTHPMFGPTFANVKELSKENAIIIKESDEEGKKFFRHFYKQFNLKIFEYTFEEHDKTTAYSLSVPFSSTMVFAATMKKQEAPGTTFRKHLEIAKGLLSEDDYLLAEILFNPYTVGQVEKINATLSELIEIIKNKDTGKLRAFIGEFRQNIAGME